MPIRTARLKIVRRLGTPLPGLTRKQSKDASADRADRAGASASRGTRRPTAHRRRLEEKQKLRFNYGVTESQMRRYIAGARRETGAIGENLLTMLERRLDNVVFRLGFAPTIRAARQLVVHGHIHVCASRVDRPGYLVSPGDEVALSPAASRREALRSLAGQPPRLRLPSHLRREPLEALQGAVVSTPSRSDVPFLIREALVIEYYAR